MEKKTFYRPEIDGLRALAIIPVILYHLNIAGFSGGFIGVDIFFVISGYLITSIILRETAEGRFSLLKFWERRMRRILPALFVVMLATTIASYFIILFPVDFIDFAHSLIAQSLFIVNIFFMRTESYFAAPAETIPLLHTWSLSVEEQFYIVFPLIVLFISFFFRKLLLPCLIFLALVSFAINVYWVEVVPFDRFTIQHLPHIWGGAINSSVAFFFLISRAWELLLGSILALLTIKISSRPIAESVSLIGITLIICAIFFITADTPFPGLAALLPTLGCALLIMSNTSIKTSIGKMLSFPLFVWIGLISYSLYLWHWPLIVLAKQYFVDSFTPSHTYAILILSFVLAYITYKYIETPFREKKYLPQQKHMLIAGVSSLVGLAILGFVISAYNGLPQRASENAQMITLAAADTNPRQYECFKNNFRKVFGEGEPCYLGAQKTEIPVTFVVWGDSHADAMMPAFDAKASEENKKGAFFAVGGCAPFLLEEPVSKDPKCTVSNEHTRAFIEENNIDTVYIVSDWKDTYTTTTSGSTTTIQMALEETVQRISKDGREIVLVKKIPKQTRYDVRKAFYIASKNTFDISKASIDYKDHIHETLKPSSAIDALSEQQGVSNIEPAKKLCTDTTCPLMFDGTIIYYDSAHINTTGALLLTDLLDI